MDMQHLAINHVRECARFLVRSYCTQYDRLLTIDTVMSYVCLFVRLSVMLNNTSYGKIV